MPELVLWYIFYASSLWAWGKQQLLEPFFFSPRIWQESRQAGQRTRQFCWFATALPCDLEQVFSLFSHSASPPAVCLIYLNGSPDEQGISHLAVLSSMWPRLPWDCCTAKPASFTTNLKHLYKILIDCFFFQGVLCASALLLFPSRNCDVASPTLSGKIFGVAQSRAGHTEAAVLHCS